MQNLEILNSLHGCFKIVKWIGFCQIYLLTSANTVTLYSIAFLSSVFLNLRRSCNSQLYFSIVFLNLRRRILSWISGLLFHLSLVSVLAAANVSLPSQLSLSRVPEEETIQRGDNIQGTETEQEQSVSWYWRVFWWHKAKEPANIISELRNEQK